MGGAWLDVAAWLGGLSASAAVGWVGYRRLRALMERARVETPREGSVRVVCGKVVGTRAMRAPVGGEPCVFAWTVVRHPDRDGPVFRRATAHDFLLDSAEGLFAVRTEGLVVIDRGGGRPDDELTRPLDADLDAALRAQGLDPDEWPLRVSEVVVREGDEVAVRGAWRREPASWAGAIRGYRADNELPTLSAVDGQLEVEVLVTPTSGTAPTA